MRICGNGYMRESEQEKARKEVKNQIFLHG